MSEVVQTEKKGTITIITLNRPSKANAINREMARSLRRILTEMDADAATRVIVLTGAGTRVFCSGLDLKERGTMSEEEVRYSRKMEIFPLYMELEKITTPLLMAVNGAAVGGGAELCMAGDIRIATESAQFGLPEPKWGIIPAGGALQRLPSIAGMGVARELMLTGRIIDARKALAFGIFNRVVPADRLMDEAMALAGEIAENSPMAVRQVKKALNFREAVHYGMWFDIEASEVCYGVRDRMEGIRAFAEKRKADWHDA